MKIHREGTNVLILLFIVIGALNVPLWLFLRPIAVAIVLSAIGFCAYLMVVNFFRSPKRSYKGQRKNMVVSSVDGRVVAIEETYEGEYLKQNAIMLSVFMSPFNVHANWYPVDGEVKYVRHHRGRFLSAYLPKASKENERSTVGVVTKEGHKITIRQIAGAMARRIVTYARKGHHADIDGQLGFIKLGSRVDLYLPLGSTILVEMNQKVKGGITPVAKLQ